VHLAVLAEVRPVGVDDRRGIVVKPRATLFEKRRHDHHPALFRDRTQLVRRRPGNLLRKSEVFVILDLAEIDRGKKLLQTHDLRALIGGSVNALDGFGDVLRGIGGAGGLDEAEFDFGHRSVRRKSGG